MNKEVRYDIYCKHCEFFESAASDDPCNGCLGTPSNGDSHVPVNFKKNGPLINYINEDPNILGYTRDPQKSKNWKNIVPPLEPTDADIKKCFTLNEDEDYYEKETNE